MVVCLEQGANDLHMVQLMPLPNHQSKSSIILVKGNHGNDIKLWKCWEIIRL